VPLSLAFETAPPADQARSRVGLGRVLAAGGDDRRVAVAERGRVRVFEASALGEAWVAELDGAVHAVAVAPGGDRIAVGVAHVVQIWTPAGLQSERDLPGGATALAFGPGGRLVAGGASAATWVETDDGWGSFATHTRQVLAVHRRGDVVLSGGADAQVAWTDLGAGRAQLLQGHVGAVRAVHLLPGGQALSASDDGSVRLWAGSEGACVWTARPPVGAVRALAVEGADILVGGDTGVLAVLDLATGETRGVLLGHRRPVVAVGLGPGGAAWSVGQGRSARSWSRASVRPLPPLLGHRGGVRACGLTATTAWTGGRDGTVRAWDRGTGMERSRWALGQSAVQALLPLSDGALVAGDAGGELVCREAGGAVRWTRGLAHDGPVTSLAGSPDGLLLSGGADGVLRAWETDAGAPLWAGAWHEDRLRCLAVAADGRVATGGYGGAVRVGSPFGGEPATWHQGESVVVGVAWCGEHVVSGALDGRLRVLTAEGVLHSVVAHEDGVVGLRALDSGRLASVGRDGWVRIWRVPELEVLDGLDLGVPLDGLAGLGPALLVGDRRGGVHLVEVTP
jgi:WD40 repeat protein